MKRETEQIAMSAARAHFEGLGCEVENVSRFMPDDLVARRGIEEIHVEVKGTTGSAGSMLLTKNEVDHARANPKSSALFVLHSIRIESHPGRVNAHVGAQLIHLPLES